MIANLWTNQISHIPIVFWAIYSLNLLSWGFYSRDCLANSSIMSSCEISFWYQWCLKIYLEQLVYFYHSHCYTHTSILFLQLASHLCQWCLYCLCPLFLLAFHHPFDLPLSSPLSFNLECLLLVLLLFYSHQSWQTTLNIQYSCWFQS